MMRQPDGISQFLLIYKSLFMRFIPIVLMILCFLLEGCATQESSPIVYKTKVGRLGDENIIIDPGKKIYKEEIRKTYDYDAQNGNYLRVKDSDKREKHTKKYEDIRYLNKAHKHSEELEVSRSQVSDRAQITQKHNFDHDVSEAQNAETRGNKQIVEVQVDKTKSQEDKIKPDHQAIKEQIVSLDQIDQEGKFRIIKPVDAEIKVHFGQTYDKVKSSGVVFNIQNGEPVRSCASGVVVGTAKDEYFGNVIIIEHSNGAYQSAYAHLSSILVTRGQVVAEGEEIGITGKSGKATKPQLYFALRKGRVPVDPVPYVK
ncbi:MAG: M23 family metallopeptidase [Rickettsiaceae bacterium]|nr:M23 family metallopeptidase [Rickettsiaceae bacterium]